MSIVVMIEHRHAARLGARCQPLRILNASRCLKGVSNPEIYSVSLAVSWCGTSDRTMGLLSHHGGEAKNQLQREPSSLAGTTLHLHFGGLSPQSVNESWREVFPPQTSTPATVLF